MGSSVEQNILVTGGAGFIGTHTVVQLMKDGFKVSIIDNLDNSVIEAVDRVRELVGPDLSKKLEFNLGDLRNKEDIEKLFSKQRFKAVGESVGNPRRYFDNNLVGTINLYETMAKYNCKIDILVTGGAGFIGTHTVVQLLKEGFKVSIIDNLDNSVIEAVHRVRELVGPDLSKKLEFNLGDLRNKGDIEKLFSKQRFDAVIHFAGLKAVGESVGNPRRYFDNNLVGTINLYETMAKYNCKMMVFSSSATVYGQPEKIPCEEDFELKAMNSYGRTKLFLEEIARDIHAAEPEWRIVLLRYFNPVGAHESGRIGEDPKGIPNNLMPYIQQVAVGRLPELNVYGHDYPTEDGSAVRDYIHVMDLADGHIAALRKLFADPKIGCTAYNLGTGRGTSVLEMVAAFEKASGKKIPIKLCTRRAGDATAVYASTERAEKELGWKAKYGVDEMCRDQWKWANNNPWGYQTKL